VPPWKKRGLGLSCGKTGGGENTRVVKKRDIKSERKENAKKVQPCRKPLARVTWSRKKENKALQGSVNLWEEENTLIKKKRQVWGKMQWESSVRMHGKGSRESKRGNKQKEERSRGQWRSGEVADQGFVVGGDAVTKKGKNNKAAVNKTAESQEKRGA